MKPSNSRARFGRRWFLGASATLLAVATLPLRALAAMARPDDAFKMTSIDDVMGAMGGAAADSDDIELEVPPISDNAANVPVIVTSNIPNTTRIMILVEKNPNPLSAIFYIPEGTVAYADTKVKVAQTGLVYAVVEADGKLYKKSMETKVTLGGCGG